MQPCSMPEIHRKDGFLAWSKAVQSGVEERLKGKSPKRVSNRNEDSAPKSIVDALCEKYKK